MNFIRNMLAIRRIEFVIAEIPIFLIPLVIARSPAANFEITLLGVIVFFLLFNFGDMTNCLADRDLDAIYKPRLSRAIYQLSPRFVTIQIVLSAFCAIAITVFIAYQTGHWFLLILVIIGLGLGAGYSLPPLHFKGRGMLQVLCLWAIIFVGPMMFIATLFSPFPSQTVLWVAAAYATVQMGIILMNTAEDLPEDSAAGIKTTIVALGLYRGLKLARWMVVGGGALLLLVLASIAILGGTRSIAIFGLLPLSVALTAAALTISRLCARLTGSQREDIILIRHAGRFVPAWLTSVAWTTLLASWCAS